MCSGNFYEINMKFVLKALCFAMLFLEGVDKKCKINDVWGKKWIAY